MSFIETVLAGVVVAAIGGLAAMAVKAPKLMRRLGGVFLLLGSVLSLSTCSFGLGVLAGREGSSADTVFSISLWVFIACAAVFGLIALSLWVEQWQEEERRKKPPQP